MVSAEAKAAQEPARLATHPPSDIESLRPELLAAQAALRRCERLGATVVSLGDVYATGHGYGPSGHLARFATGDAAGVLQARG